MASVILQDGKSSSLERRHPWVFSGAVSKVEGSPQMGETVTLLDARKRFLGYGAWSPHSQIQARVWSFAQDEPVDEAWLRLKLSRAIEARGAWMEPGGACRLVCAESDGLPGLIVDRYGEFLVCQILSAGPERWREVLVKHLRELVPCRGVYERSDADVRRKEGLEPRVGLMAGEEPPEYVEINEDGRWFLVDVRQGHKTGFYLDQRENRTWLSRACKGAEVLNCFAYTGGFGVAAKQGGATSVINVEASDLALALAAKNQARNGHEGVENLRGDVFEVLRKFRDQGRRFDVIVLDPPKFAESKAQVDKAARGYKDINLLGFKLLRSGGRLFTFSCSGLMKSDLFQKIVADAALDAGRDAQIERWLHQGPDHPTSLPFPEGLYLKGLVCRV